MELLTEDFPATLQAYELKNDQEIFIAEQVINSQAEIETFTTRYTGKLIKAKKAIPAGTANGSFTYKKQPSSTGLMMIIIILVIVALVIYGISTGWIQEKFNIKI